ncbi:MAG: hypothetical protein AAFY05_18780 [Pseudomonadota bacterium]
MYTFSGIQDLAFILIKTELLPRSEWDFGLFRLVDENGPSLFARRPVKIPDAPKRAAPRGRETAASRVRLRLDQAG